MYPASSPWSFAPAASRLLGPAPLHVGAEAQDGLALELGNAGLVEIHHSGDFTQRELFTIVQPEHVLLDSRHLVDCGGEQFLQFGALEQMRGPIVLAIGDKL